MNETDRISDDEVEALTEEEETRGREAGEGTRRDLAAAPVDATTVLGAPGALPGVEEITAQGVRAREAIQGVERDLRGLTAAHLIQVEAAAIQDEDLWKESEAIE